MYVHVYPNTESMSVWQWPRVETAEIHRNDGDHQDKEIWLLCSGRLQGTYPNCYCTLARHVYAYDIFYLYWQDFYEKYQFLIGSESADLGTQISTFLTGLGFGGEHFQIGKTKVCIICTIVVRWSTRMGHIHTWPVCVCIQTMYAAAYLVYIY